LRATYGNIELSISEAAGTKRKDLPVCGVLSDLRTTGNAYVRTAGTDTGSSSQVLLIEVGTQKFHHQPTIGEYKHFLAQGPIYEIRGFPGNFTQGNIITNISNNAEI
jgi:hypothetical protein